MMRCLSAFSGVVLLGLLASCTPVPPDPGDAPLETLQAREASLLAALSALDADGVSAHFADEGVLHVANMPEVRGRDAIRGFYGNVFRFMLASEPTPESARVSEAGDMGYTMGRVVNSFRSEDGSVEYRGKYLLVWERREGEWMAVVYAVSDSGSGEGP
jgi:ketosteroid isomerase-like protein